MNLNRRKNIFTLGDYQHKPTVSLDSKSNSKNRRQNSDPFERDPFKIQSYNFRYADRPTFPLQNLVNRINNHSTEKPFETYYYNHDFSTLRHDKENPSTNKFHEHRRRKFVQDQSNTTPKQNSRLSSNTEQCQQYDMQTEISEDTTPFAAFTGSSSGGATSADPTNKIISNVASLLSSGTNPTKGVPLLRRANTKESMQGLCSIYSPHAQNTTQSIQQQSYRKHQLQQQQQHQIRNESANYSYANGPGPSCSRSSLAASGSKSRWGVLPEYEQFRTVSPHNDSSKSKRCERETYNLPRSSSSHKNLSRCSVVGRNRSESANTYAVPPVDPASSGCQININIKGMEESQNGENILIKIESDMHGCLETRTNNINEVRSKTDHLRNTPSIMNNLAKKLPSFSTDHFNIGPFRSSETFIVNKRISKFSINEDKHTDTQQRVTNPNYTTSLSRSPVGHTSNERVPSLLTWKNSDDKIKKGDNSKNSGRKIAMSDIILPKNAMRRGRDPNNKNRNLKTKDKPMMATASAVDSTTMMFNQKNKISNGDLMKSSKMSGIAKSKKDLDLKIQNMKMPRRSISACSRNSNLTLRNACGKLQLSANPNDEDPISDAAKMQNQFLKRSTSLIYNSCVDKKSPVNVNINVFTDKYKLMRV